MRVKNSDVRISYNSWSVAVFLMLFWGFHYTVLDILHITSLGILCIELFAVFSVMLMTVRRAMLQITPLFLWIIFLMLTWRNNYYIEHNALSRPVAMFLVIVLSYCLQFSDQWYRSLKQCITIFAVEHFVLAWFFFLAKNFYFGKIVPLFSNEFTSRLIGYRNENILMGFTDHYTISGIFFAFGCMSAFIYWLQKKKSVTRIFCLLIILASLLMTQKRGPLVFTACALFVIFWVSEGIKIRSVSLFLACCIGFAIAYFCAVQVYPALGNVFLRFINGDIYTGRNRLYEIAIELYKENPIFGAGWGQYRKYSLKYYHTEYAAHNIYLQVASELGIVGLFFVMLLFFGVLFYTIYVICRNRKLMEKDKNVDYALLFSLGTQVYFIFYGLTGNPIYDPQCFLPYFISIAIPFSVMIETIKS